MVYFRYSLIKILDKDLEQYALVNSYNCLERSTSSGVDKGLKPNSSYSGYRRQYGELLFTSIAVPETIFISGYTLSKVKGIVLLCS